MIAQAAQWTGPRSGELFAGVGGLGIAVDQVFGTKPAWFAEFDTAPSKVLTHHNPGVPNFGDVRAIDFRTVPHTQVRAGGFPCQDVSLAGRRRGMTDGTRSGLWSEFARSIEEDRPDWVVIENVRGLLSADASSGNMEPCPWCVGDESGEHALRALGAVLGDLAELGFDAEWISLRAADIGAPHGRFRVFILAWPREATVHPGHGSRGAEHREQFAQGGQHRGTRESGAVAPAVTLLPTPVAQPSGNTSEDHLRKKPGREVVTDLAIIAENGLIGSGGRLLPTPRTTDMNGAGVHGEGGMDLRTTVTLLPTPTASEGAKGGPNQAYSSGGSTLSGTIPHLAGWGPYADAIERWESVIGRPAPSPVRNDGKGGKPRLNPELTEWMMGWPSGWVTTPAIGLSRAEQLKACGNGVVPQQAAFALRLLLARPGVPAINWGLAA